jgi:nitrate/nitrite transport system substrate-binding protein
MHCCIRLAVDERNDFAPYPWHSMAIWILTQMKRWGQVKGDLAYQAVAEHVFLAADAAKTMRDMGLVVPESSYRSVQIMGKTFNPAEPQAYLDSFAIKRSQRPWLRSAFRRRCCSCC